jgi:hypothetical protein
MLIVSNILKRTINKILLKHRGNPEIVAKSEYVFPQDPCQGWEKLIRRIGLEDFRWHDLRHCCASYMRQDGLSLGHIGANTLATNLRRLLSVMRIFVRKELLRLERPFLSVCTDNLILNAYEIDFKNTLNCKSLKYWWVGGGSNSGPPH